MYFLIEENYFFSFMKLSAMNFYIQFLVINMIFHFFIIIGD